MTTTRGSHSSGFDRRSVLQMALGAGTLPLLGGQALAQGKPKPAGQVIIGLSQEPTVFNPVQPNIDVDHAVFHALFSPLFGMDPKGDFFPLLVTEVPSTANGGISEDGLSWKIKLRSDATWHDGKPVTAEDVKFTFDLINNPNFPAASRLGHDRLEDIKVVSPTELTWRMKTPFAPYMSILARTFLVPKHVLQGPNGIDNAAFLRAPVGCGPYKWSQRTPGDNITVVAHDRYFGEGPHIEKVIFKYIPDLTVLYTQFRTGDIDYIGLQGISADRYEQAKTLPDRVVTTATQSNVESLFFNVEKPQFKDAAVREALYYAIDKKAIIDGIYYGVPNPAESYLPKDSWAYNKALPEHQYDPAKANAMLDAAGWKKGAGGIREKNGVRLEFTNSTTAGNHLREQMQQLVQQQFQEIGVAMTIKNLPPAVMWGDYWINSQFDTAFAGAAFMMGGDPAVEVWLSSKSINAKGGAGRNTMQYSSPEVDALLDKGATTFDRAKRIEAYHAIQARLRKDLPFLPMFNYVNVEGTKTKLKGYRSNINTLVNCWNVNTWRWES